MSHIAVSRYLKLSGMVCRSIVLLAGFCISIEHPAKGLCTAVAKVTPRGTKRFGILSKFPATWKFNRFLKSRRSQSDKQNAENDRDSKVEP